jgi:ABC-type lipoprotein release transport system permease subunit
VLIGLIAALGVMRLIQWRLYQVAPNDVPTLAVVAGGITLIALVTALVPARRALVVDPVRSLKME